MNEMEGTTKPPKILGGLQLPFLGLADWLVAGAALAECNANAGTNLFPLSARQSLIFLVVPDNLLLPPITVSMSFILCSLTAAALVLDARW